eukprot:TRINITY_DN8944_c0_g1_i1.p1 TRINITY_DN8944_c0_g1~~TRINITY_DN8944_c0_g1_i1.p1  ORF type:complete len:339 (+),score=20.76 TRINITY_DN8944_c0_g1_i1:260-1276(+)
MAFVSLSPGLSTQSLSVVAAQRISSRLLYKISGGNFFESNQNRPRGNSFSQEKRKRRPTECRCLRNGNEREMINPAETTEEAAEQARRCLSEIIAKTLKKPKPKQKQKKRKQQLRLRVEIPLMDESAASFVSVMEKLLEGFPIIDGFRRQIGVFWSGSLRDASLQSGKRDFVVKSWNVLDSFESGFTFDSDIDAAFFIAPETQEMRSVEAISKDIGATAVVLLNPRTDDEAAEEMSAFLSSFEVVYSFTPLAIRGFFGGKREGAVFRFFSGSRSRYGSPWLLLVKEKGKYRCVSEFRKRPDSYEIETALYDLLARDSPLTKSFKFLKSLVSGKDAKLS